MSKINKTCKKKYKIYKKRQKLLKIYFIIKNPLVAQLYSALLLSCLSNSIMTKIGDERY